MNRRGFFGALAAVVAGSQIPIKAEAPPVKAPGFHAHEAARMKRDLESGRAVNKRYDLGPCSVAAYGVSLKMINCRISTWGGAVALYAPRCFVTGNVFTRTEVKQPRINTDTNKRKVRDEGDLETIGAMVGGGGD